MQDTDEVQTPLYHSEAAREYFVEPDMLGPVDILESTSFFQVTSGAPDVLDDITG